VSRYDPTEAEISAARLTLAAAVASLAVASFPGDESRIAAHSTLGTVEAHLDLAAEAGLPAEAAARHICRARAALAAHKQWQADYLSALRARTADGAQQADQACADHIDDGDDTAAFDEFARDVLRRCRWALAHNDGHPSPAWSTGEQLAVALVLRDADHLAAMDYTPTEAAVRVLGGMYDPPADFNAWLTAIRTALTADEDADGP
jgi:hypothetical protein